jgi:hypothetical protein
MHNAELRADLETKHMAVVSELKLALQNKNEELKKAILLVGKKLWFAFIGQLLQNLINV